MPVESQEYVDSLPAIYRDVFAAFPEIQPGRKAGWGLAYQTLLVPLDEKHLHGELVQRYSIGEIMQACENMQQGGAVDIKNRILVHPTPFGEELIVLLTPREPVVSRVPPFPAVPSGEG
jgi:hypothetical protein